jgi:tetratricopeptide (TPR) repeat protein
MGEQLSLFNDEYTLLNSGVLELTRLDLDEAKKTFQCYREMWKDSDDIDCEVKLADFLIRGFANAPNNCPDEPAYLYELWLSFEDYVKSIGFESENIILGIKNSFFPKVLASIDRWNLTDTPYLSDNIPIGYVYIQAGQYNLAVKSLQACILATPDNAASYGYLGDAYMLRDEPEVARRCYLEACLINPADIDWDHMKDGNLLKLKDQLVETFDMNETLASEWLPSYACIQGLFKPKMIKFNEELKKFVYEYLALRKTYLKEPTPDLEPRLFIRAIILCDNEPFMKLIKGIDFIDVRRRMKDINPSLFSEYLKYVEKRKQTGD